jgi:hypothetical protein
MNCHALTFCLIHIPIDAKLFAFNCYHGYAYAFYISSERNSLIKPYRYKPNHMSVKETTEFCGKSKKFSAQQQKQHRVTPGISKRTVNNTIERTAKWGFILTENVVVGDGPVVMDQRGSASATNGPGQLAKVLLPTKLAGIPLQLAGRWA